MFEYSNNPNFDDDFITQDILLVTDSLAARHSAFTRKKVPRLEEHLFLLKVRFKIGFCMVEHRSYEIQSTQSIISYKNLPRLLTTFLFGS